ncbi:single-stranded DNA-binding protein [bacterium]|nr:single-stranded DNA-binding protein [bacterium]
MFMNTCVIGGTVAESCRILSGSRKWTMYKFVLCCERKNQKDSLGNPISDYITVVAFNIKDVADKLKARSGAFVIVAGSLQIDNVEDEKGRRNKMAYIKAKDVRIIEQKEVDLSDCPFDPD